MVWYIFLAMGILKNMVHIQHSRCSTVFFM